jgi:glyoxylase-like metal-dependent hydrolase (beta-lactamase superfamily II)
VSSPRPTSDWEVRWIHGSASRRRLTDPAWQVHHYGEDTVVLRQSKDANYEAPFVFLLFGAERALLLDTGATGDDRLRRTIDELVADRLVDRPAAGYQLVVAHTHAHGDHIAGDTTFAGRPDTVVVGTSAPEVQAFFGFTQWPAEVVGYELGSRRLEIIGIPGHEPASIAVYDERTGLLLTGDSVYPGRIYVRDFPAYVDSLNRLVELAESRQVSHVVGCHIEMTTRPGRDYHLGCRYQPDEPPLQLSVAQLRAFRDAAVSVADRPGPHRFDDFVLFNGMGWRTQVPLVTRALAGRLVDVVRRR